MSNNLFNSKNLWIDAETARVLGINSHNTVYINGDKVLVNHFYSDNIEFAIPLFALRAEQLYRLFSKRNSDSFYFRVFSNFKENTSRLFGENFESLELLVQSNRILEEQKEMHESKRIDIFFKNNELSSKKITKSMDKKIKKLINKKKELEEKNNQLEIQLKKQLFIQFNSSNELIELDQEESQISNIDNAELIVEKQETNENSTNNKITDTKDDNKKEESLDDIILDKNFSHVNDIDNNHEDNKSSEEGKKINEGVAFAEQNNDETTNSKDLKLDMDVEEEKILESNSETTIEEYETISLEQIDKSTYSKECLKIEHNINRNKDKIQKLNEKIYSIVGNEVRSPEEFRNIYNKASARLENIKVKAKIAENLSTEEFNKIKPYVVAEMQNLVFTCYDAMCEANAVYDDSREMFAKLILLIKRNLTLFDNKNK